MKMVAAAKMRKVQDRMLNFRPYASRMGTVLTDLAKVAEREIHPLLALRLKKKVEVVVITSDKGLCGAFNTNILKAANNYINGLKKEGIELTLTVVGRKARDFFKRRSIPMRNEWVGLSGRISYTNAQEIAGSLIEGYTGETFDEVIVIYNEFKSMIAQKVTIMKLLPVGVIEGEEGQKETSMTADYLYEPSRAAIFERLLPKYIEIQVYRALLESSASEEAARMAAMENATKNCSELIAQDNTPGKQGKTGGHHRRTYGHCRRC